MVNKTTTFRGKIYTLHGIFRTKSSVNKQAAIGKKVGDKPRIVKLDEGGYALYFRYALPSRR